MYLTMEVRWFYPGPLPGQIVDWLHTPGCLPAAQPPRVDHYLSLPSQPTLGIKLREGHVELKARLGNARKVEMGPGVAGMMAPWRKWSFPLAFAASSEGAPLEQLLVPASSWIAVEKERLMQRWQLDGGLEAAPVRLGAPVVQGCEFELSQVRAGGEEWWSACFEAFGPESGLERALLSTAAKVLGPGCPLNLDVEHSLSYPAWLARFEASAEPANTKAPGAK